MLKLGNNRTLAKINLGDTKARKLMLGNRLIWQLYGIRYIRDTVRGSSSNRDHHWLEFQIYNKAGNNLALTSSLTVVEGTEFGRREIEWVKNGRIDDLTKYYGLSGDRGIIQFDLGTERFDLDYIKVWHYPDGRRYNSNIEVSPDGVNWKKLYNSSVDGEYPETIEGKIIKINY